MWWNSSKQEKKKEKAIEERWDPLKKKYGFEETLLNNIIHRYQQRGLDYHNINQMIACLDEFEPVRGMAENTDSLELAIWLHNIIYDPKSRDNKMQGMILTDIYFKDEKVPLVMLNNTKRLIMSTKYDATLLDMDAMLIHDIVMSILGKDWKTFRTYNYHIQKEYSFMELPDYRKGRADFLKKVLAQDRIYSTNHFHELYETQARKNIELALKQM